jgi:uncharacterized RDD family membrane protein YckC
MANTTTPNYFDTILDQPEYRVNPAGSSQRFGNCMFDIVFGLVFSVLFRTILVMTGVLQPQSEVQSDGGTSNGLINYVTALLVYVFYYFAFETLTGGKTIGKYLTGTRAVNRDGTRISTLAAFIRSICRFVPFEPISALGGPPPQPWHDSWSKTVVVDERSSRLPPQV